MPLIPGTRLGPYEIVAPLGAGGMGEVYRARDTRLGREVAIKVLPQHLSREPEVRARFEREAKTVSGLNHPNICVLHDVGREGDTDYLVMELVDGETLSARLTRGPLPVPEVLRLGAEIADALDRAHRAGVVHRDLKPGNVMLTKSGAKLMDFGLARATGLAGGDGSTGATRLALSHSPTVAAPLTAEGTILGTFQYMSPEQLEGKEADARADIWAFGCVLYELATGRRAFEGRSQASLISSIMSGQPEPMARLAPMSPPALERMVLRCLAKDPDDRWQSARDLVLELRAMVSGAGADSGVTAGASAAPAARRRTPAWLVPAALALVGFAAGGLLLPRFLHRSAPIAPMVLSVPLPDGVLMVQYQTDLAVAPDGRAVAYAGVDTAGVTRLWYVPLDGGEAKALPGTEGASLPFWSGDGASIGFFSNHMMRRIAIAGGTPQEICPAPSPRGAAWNRDGVILFAPDPNGPIMRVAASGGTPVPATKLDASRHQVAHRFPRFLPDGRHFLFATLPIVDKEHEIEIGELGSVRTKTILRADGTPAVSSDGWILYQLNHQLMAQRFDFARGNVSGEPKPLIETSQFQGQMGSPSAWLSANGTLYCMPTLAPRERLLWVDRTGHSEPVAGISPSGWTDPRFSPDGSRVAMVHNTAARNASVGTDIWLADPVRGTATPFTFESAIALYPVWSPDGTRLVYAAPRDGVYNLIEKPIAGGEARSIAKARGFILSGSAWTPDGRWILASADDPGTGMNIHRIAADGSGLDTVLVASPGTDDHGAVSPDGRWLVYDSDESGRPEVYADAFPGLGAKLQVSTNGGRYPKWNPNGRELVFEGMDGGFYSADVTAGPTLKVGTPKLMFRMPEATFDWTLTPDGRRFLVSAYGANWSRWSPRVIVNWQEMAKKGR